MMSVRGQLLLHHKEKVMRNISIRIMLVTSLLLSAFVANADKLDLSEGTMTTAGIVAFQISQADISNITSSNLKWNVSVDFGYFIIDRLALNVEARTGGTFTNPINDATVGGGIGAHYYFDLGSMINPYVGVVPEILWSNTPNAVTASSWNIRLPISAGILIGLNQHVALDIGAEAGFAWGISTGANPVTAFDMTVGYVGVRAFF